ncbi:hypothetical protein GCM10028805_43990 [Spirosoma harenae]
MKYLLILFFALAGLTSQAQTYSPPLSGTALKALVDQKLTPSGTDLITAIKLREMQKALIDVLVTKGELVFTTSYTGTQLAATGPTGKLIMQVVSGAITFWVYHPLASPTLQSTLTYGSNN